jgi:hypothetical protein
MKTYTEYEPADIKMDGFAEGEKMDEVHSFLLGQLLIIGITGFKPQPSDPPDDKLYQVKRHIADFLNGAAKAGIVITKAESVPAVFRDK